MLRKSVKPFVLDMKKKKTDYKAILEEIQNEGQEFNAESSTNTYISKIGTASLLDSQVCQKQE